MDQNRTVRVVVCGGGFAGVACAQRLATDDRVRVTLVDKHGYQQFQPLLYQVATAELAAEDTRFDLAKVFRHLGQVEIRTAEATAVEPATRTVHLADGAVLTGDYLVLAAGSQPNFFHTAGAAEYAYPLYDLDQAERIRAELLTLFADASAKPELAEEGALTFVVVGSGPTGVEAAGALADLVRDVMPRVYGPAAMAQARIVLVDLGHTVLPAFSDAAHTYAASLLARRGVTLRLGVAVKEVGPGHVTLSDGTRIGTRLVVWAGGERGAPVAGEAGVGLGHGGRIDVNPDLTVPGWPELYAVGDIANIPSPAMGTLPQLGSVAQQSGQWAARNILAVRDGGVREAFHYHDRGIMAMLGRQAAVAELGVHRHELHGRLAFAAWLGVHAELLASLPAELSAFLTWANEFYLRPHHRAAKLLDPEQVDAPRIDWSRA